MLAAQRSFIISIAVASAEVRRCAKLEWQDDQEAFDPTMTV